MSKELSVGIPSTFNVISPVGFVHNPILDPLVVKLIFTLKSSISSAIIVIKIFLHGHKSRFVVFIVFVVEVATPVGTVQVYV